MKISIVITAYNVEAYIAEAVRSCMEQTHKDLEIIVVEDKSTDGTPALLEKLAQKDGRIRIINNEANVGAGMSRRIGSQAATGDFVLLLDGDDYLDENFIENLVKRQEETGADIVSGGITIEREDGSYDITCYGETITEGVDRVTKFWGERIVFMNNKIIRRSLFDKVPYCTRRYIEDTPTIIPQLYLANRVAYTNNPGYHYRMRGGSLTHEATAFKTTLFRLLCVRDLMDFFGKNDPAYLQTIPLGLSYNNLLKQMAALKPTKEDAMKYPEEWVEFTLGLVETIH